ncbi:hypothetical protein NPX13_g11367 [Xylaria arbuscula]|uniref:Uncharacterized protein n=1 Tax=Xylaria arbuscula TaxID=114810 RepID=A0A9W8N2U2_9PEZI|nr:hypothetical protein NPX13_g11367 [Xylaria arbuscula]
MPEAKSSPHAYLSDAKLNNSGRQRLTWERVARTSQTETPLCILSRSRRPCFRITYTCTRSAKVVIEPLERVADEGQTHFWRVLDLLARRQSLRLEHRRIIRLVDLIRREIRRVNGRRQPRLKRRSDAPQAIKLNTPEEGMALDLVRSTSSKSSLRVADQTKSQRG